MLELPACQIAHGSLGSLWQQGCTHCQQHGGMLVAVNTQEEAIKAAEFIAEDDSGIHQMQSLDPSLIRL